jgi:hypothetical protein
MKTLPQRSCKSFVSRQHTVHKAWKHLFMSCKGLQLRLELGNVVTGEGERGESGSWRLDG